MPSEPQLKTKTCLESQRHAFIFVFPTVVKSAPIVKRSWNQEKYTLPWP
jgi:hypothetical protein